MTDIMDTMPTDILIAAENALDNLLCNCVESCGGSEGLRAASINDIAKAILAERASFAPLQGLAPVIEEIHEKWDEGMRAGKLLIALMDPTLKYRADITAIHAAISKVGGAA
jgi:hypothetical protein